MFFFFFFLSIRVRLTDHSKSSINAGEKKKREKNGSLTAASATKHTQMMHSTKKTKQGECEGVYERERQRI